MRERARHTKEVDGEMTRPYKKSTGCVTCDFIDLKLGWPCSKCKLRMRDNPNLHSSYHKTGFWIDGITNNGRFQHYSFDIVKPREAGK